MIITLTGQNSYSLQLELHKLASGFVSEHGNLALERIDGEDKSFSHIQEAITSLPFLADKKLVVLRTPSTNKQFAEKFEQLLDDIPETTELIIVEPKLDRRLTYYKSLKKKTDFREFPELDPANL